MSLMVSFSSAMRRTSSMARSRELRRQRHEVGGHLAAGAVLRVAQELAHVRGRRLRHARQQVRAHVVGQRLEQIGALVGRHLVGDAGRLGAVQLLEELGPARALELVEHRGGDRLGEGRQHQGRGLLGQTIDELGQVGGVQLLGELGGLSGIVLQGFFELGHQQVGDMHGAALVISSSGGGSPRRPLPDRVGGRGGGDGDGRAAGHSRAVGVDATCASSTGSSLRQARGAIKHGACNFLAARVSMGYR